MRIVENADLQGFVALAQKYPTVEEFIRRTDGMDVLYRGHHDDVTGDNSFMTDWVGHAAQYIDETGRIDAFAYDPNDVLYYDDRRFDELRGAYGRLSDEQLSAIYRAALQGNRFAEHHQEAFGTVTEVLRSTIPYSEIAGDPTQNDALVPLMQKYARDAHGKNIIAFLGSDYADYGGQTEYVVGDISRLTDLRKLYAAVKP